MSDEVLANQIGELLSELRQIKQALAPDRDPDELSTEEACQIARELRENDYG